MSAEIFFNLALIAVFAWIGFELGKVHAQLQALEAPDEMKPRVIRWIEKLLPERFWKRTVMTPDAYWTALAGSVQPQTQAVLHAVQDKFNAHMEEAMAPDLDDERRLRALDRAAAMASLLDEVDKHLRAAPEEAKRREEARTSQAQATA